MAGGIKSILRNAVGKFDSVDVTLVIELAGN